jgi:hypothetical protein
VAGMKDCNTDLHTLTSYQHPVFNFHQSYQPPIKMRSNFHFFVEPSIFFPQQTTATFSFNTEASEHVYLPIKSQYQIFHAGTNTVPNKWKKAKKIGIQPQKYQKNETKLMKNNRYLVDS